MKKHVEIVEKVSSFFKNRRMFQYIQLGVSSRCFLNCVACPRTCFREHWNSMDMTVETYKNIRRFFPYAENVYLSGWGEPLLNSFFFDMIQDAKTAGCSVGFTTNGALLDNAVMRKIIDLQTDLVSISLAGAKAETHESLRVGSSFEQLISNIRSIVNLKETLRSNKPQILLLFMMTNKSLDELPLSIEFAAKVGADGVVATNLDYVAVPLHDELRAFSCDKPDEEFVEFVWKAEELARDRCILFHAFPLEIKPVPMCSEDPLNSLYISEDGCVSPCVYLTPPIQEIPRIFCGKKIIVPRISFGNIREKNLFDIWNSYEYVSFRKKWLKSASCESVDHLPNICRTCYKAYGI